MPKFFVEKNLISNGIVNIKGEDVNHIINVLRNGKGDELQVCDFEDGINYIVEIIDYKKDNVECKILEKMESNTESNVHITIFQGLPKFDKMELIIQKATEIGVCNIVPLKMKRCVVKFDGKDLSKKIERWNKIAQIAAKQSMRDTITKVKNIQTISDLLEEIEEFDEVIVAYEKEKSNTLKKELKQITKNKEYKIGIVIGPEGGIDEKEIEELGKISKVKFVILGNIILRTENEGLVMASNIIYELEDNEQE